jgi:hypothetical protein
MVPVQGTPLKAKLALLVPVMVIPVIVTALALALLTKMGTGKLIELTGIVPNWIGLGERLTGTAANAVAAVKVAQAQTKAMRDPRLILAPRFCPWDVETCGASLLTIRRKVSGVF